MNEGMAGFLMGFMVAVVAMGFFFFSFRDHVAGKVCDAAAAELERDCFIDDGACMCAVGGQIVELGK